MHEINMMLAFRPVGRSCVTLCVSDALNSLFAVLHYAYWGVMNRSERRWLTKYIKSHLMSADSRGKSRCHFEFSLGPPPPKL